MTHYAEALKNRGVTKLLPPENPSVSEIAKEIGMTVQTLERWRDETQSRPVQGRAWAVGARLEAVITAAGLSITQIGAANTSATHFRESLRNTA